MKKDKIKICEYKNCGNSFTSKRPWQKFCSRKCRAIYHKGFFEGVKNKQVRNTSRIGTISELIVAVDLFTKGYEVFTAICGGAFCDLVAIKNDSVSKIQVRTGKIAINGSKSYPKVKIKNFDVLAVVYGGNNIEYTPDMK